MKLRMSENSLFAILLRSQWWISFAIAAGVMVVARLFVEDVYIGVFAALPFLVIGCVAAWRQLRSPSAARVSETLEVLRAMPWGDFSAAVEAAFRRDGYTVRPFAGAGADFELTRGGRTSLVACKRWKVARTGIEPLRELDDARRAHEAAEAIYVAAGEVTDTASAFARKSGIRLLAGVELAKLLPDTARGKKRPT